MKEREREKHGFEKHQLFASCMYPQVGIKPATQLCALTRNRIYPRLVYWMMFLTTEPSGQIFESHKCSCFLLPHNYYTSPSLQQHLLQVTTAGGSSLFSLLQPLSPTIYSARSARITPSLSEQYPTPVCWPNFT